MYHFILHVWKRQVWFLCSNFLQPQTTCLCYHLMPMTKNLWMQLGQNPGPACSHMTRELFFHYNQVPLFFILVCDMFGLSFGVYAITNQKISTHMTLVDLSGSHSRHDQAGPDQKWHKLRLGLEGPGLISSLKYTMAKARAGRDKNILAKLVTKHYFSRTKL